MPIATMILAAIVAQVVAAVELALAAAQAWP